METMDGHSIPSDQMAAAITRAASKQTYFTIRLFADRGRAADAFRSYAYFRWLDDVLDESADLDPQQGEAGTEKRLAFAYRQQSLLDACYRGETPELFYAEERMLVDLVRHDHEINSGLQIYLRSMMDVMLFDARRRGQVISQAELSDYSFKLARAVTEALYYFIGHGDPSPCHEVRYLAVNAAHITHMLRDTLEDVENGFFNIPAEYLAAHGISPRDVNTRAYREWVRSRVRLAREYFKKGRECTVRVVNWRCRLAGCAYTARFEWMLGAIERDNYFLRPGYPQRKSLAAGLWMVWSAVGAMFVLPGTRTSTGKLNMQPDRSGKR